MKKTVAYLLLGSLLVISCNNFVNGHYHQLANGRKLYHAHPYESSSSHSHTNGQFQHLQSVLDLFNVLTFATAISLILFASDFVYRELNNLAIFKWISFASHNKSPPFSIRLLPDSRQVL